MFSSDPATFYSTGLEALVPKEGWSHREAQPYPLSCGLGLPPAPLGSGCLRVNRQREGYCPGIVLAGAIDPDHAADIWPPLHGEGKQECVWNRGDPLGWSHSTPGSA